MSRTQQLSIVFVVISTIICSHYTQMAHAQTSYSVEDCRNQCYTTYQYFVRIIISNYFRYEFLPRCYDSCGPTPAPTPSTTTTTTPTTSTTTTTTTTSTTTTTTPPLGTCGVQTRVPPVQTNSFRIVGGERAYECEFPWMVGVTVNSFFCGGAILDKRHIITAAHCLRDRYTREVASPSQVFVRVGSSQLNLLTALPVSRVNIDTRHVPIVNDYDVAILTLAQDLVFGDCAAPICLPESSERPEEADYCVAAGWGIDSFGSTTLMYNLMKVTLPLVPNSLCIESYGSRYVNDAKLCAGNWYNGGVDTCQGDSGGPLMCYKNGVFKIHGIVSFGSGCARARYPGIYTRVAYKDILNFVKQTAGLV